MLTKAPVIFSSCSIFVTRLLRQLLVASEFAEPLVDSVQRLNLEHGDEAFDFFLHTTVWNFFFLQEDRKGTYETAWMKLDFGPDGSGDDLVFVGLKDKPFDTAVACRDEWWALRETAMTQHDLREP